MPKKFKSICLFTILLGVVSGAIYSVNDVAGQEIRVLREIRDSGTVRGIRPGRISIGTADGKVLSCKIQNKDEAAIAIAGKPFRVPAAISVTGSLPMSLVEPGMIVRFNGRIDENGKADGSIQELDVLFGKKVELKVECSTRPEPDQPAACEVVGRVIGLKHDRLQLQVPKSKWINRERIVFEVAENGTLNVDDDNLNLVQPGDEVTHVLASELSSGEKIVKEIKIQLSADRETMTTTFHDKLEQQFSNLSDEPAQPRQLVSDNFILYTDLSDRNARILLKKLETMYELIGGYFGKRPRFPIECYVVSDINKWRGQNLHPSAVAKILEPAGLTLSAPQPGTSAAKAVVYSCDKHGVCQHEAVHAFCAQAFGTTGPVWYSEGMAEMGQYWKPGELAVNIDPVVIDYLIHAPPKKMKDIVAAGQITGDSWQAYAWRWALCHLLANNPNYAQRFKVLGLTMMSGGKDSFENAFGGVAANISFEYDQFVQNIGNGYRVDLCAWDWSITPRNLTGNGKFRTEVRAAAGWQPTKLLLRKDVSYDFSATGEWQADSFGAPVTPDGDPVGRGTLIGVILHDFKLTDPFEMGASGSFVAPIDGQLYLRCRDDWTDLADNEGTIKVQFERSPKVSIAESK